jgi:hypothetical protein
MKEYFILLFLGLSDKSVRIRRRHSIATGKEQPDLRNDTAPEVSSVII